MDINHPDPSPDDEIKKQEDQFEEGTNQPDLEAERGEWQPAEEPDAEIHQDGEPEEIQPQPDLLGEVEEEIPPQPTLLSEVEEETTGPEEEKAALPNDGGIPAPIKEESRLIKGFRRALQWAIIGLVLVAIGGALAFFLTAQPARKELQATKAELQSLQEKLTQSEADLAAVQVELSGTKEYLKASEETLLASSNRIQFLRVLSDINTARYAIVKKQGATARLALLDAQTELKTILEVISKSDQELATLLETRLQRAINNLSGDTAVAEADLNTLIQDMGQLESLLFPE